MKESTDFLVIGSGISGLSFAIKAARLGTVTIVTKKAKVDTATNLAQGGIAAVLSPDDSFALHIEDTLRSGAGLCHEDIVRLVVETGPDRIEELIRLGVQFQSEANNPSHLDLGKEGGHSARRIAHAMDLTGRKIEEGLLAQVAANPRITVLENHLAVDLLVSSKTGTPYQPHDSFSDATNHGVSPQRSNNHGTSGRRVPQVATSGLAMRTFVREPDRSPQDVVPCDRLLSDQCLGAYVFDRETGRIDTWQAKATVLCTGGTGKVYLYTTNPDIATGDGIAMAYRAGARVANLEFVQFHPTCLYHPQVKNFLISEAVRGEGGRLIDKHGHPFMHKYDPRGELATRDTVARAIDSEMKASGDDCVYLDITHQPAEFLKNRFPTIYNKCLSLGIDMTKVPIPVVPAAHYMCGGVVTDQWGRTNIEGLFAFGETACTGLHGGNRLASNSLLEAVVFAHQAFLECEREWPELRKAVLPEVAEWSAGEAQRIEENVLVSHNWDQIRRLMWNYVGIVRTEKRLALVQERLRVIAGEVNQHYRDYILTPDLIELRNIAQVAELIVRCACIRKESRGLHYLVDFPKPDDAHWKKDTVIQRQNGEPGLAACAK